VAVSSDLRLVLFQAEVRVDNRFEISADFCNPGTVKATTHAVYAVDVETGALVHSRRASEDLRTCTLPCSLSVPVIGTIIPFDLECISIPIEDPFSPAGVAILFGGS
jgi:hypothetical protein